MKTPVFIDLGLIDYQTALNEQLKCVDHLMADSEHPGYVLFCSHPAIVTLGRQTEPQDMMGWQGETLEVSRGGRATYHGPSQAVIYPILNIRTGRKNRGPQEVRGFIRDLENCVVLTLNEFGIQSRGKTSSDDKTELSDTGVWIQDRKIASLGIAVKKWITYHGVAVNILNDPTAFVGINPCGYKSSVMTSLEKEIQKPISIEDFNSKIKKYLIEYL